jgi:hypothetical protein
MIQLQHPEGLPAKPLLDQLAQAVPSTEFEQTTLSLAALRKDHLLLNQQPREGELA